jgi:pimeloyl-ACP methyl ester carboxylesterase
MSRFLQRPWSQWAVIVRPREVSAQTPIIFSIDGFQKSSADSRKDARSSAVRVANDYANAADELGAIFVALDVCVDGGHHGFTDSETNGPVGSMLATEFIPWLDAHLGVDSASTAHYVTGHSSGGWATANLLMRHPGVFDGGVGTSPDPVDFRDFHGMNLYVDDTAFLNRDGLKPVFGRDIYRWKEGKPPVTFDQVETDEVSAFFPQQLAAYEAAFSPVDADGRPRQLFDRESGAIDREVAEWWIANHDLSRLLVLGDSGDLGRLTLTCGVEDEFGLHRPLRRFKDRAASTTTMRPEAIQFLSGGHYSTPADLTTSGLIKRISQGETPFDP